MIAPRRFDHGMPGPTTSRSWRRHTRG